MNYEKAYKEALVKCKAYIDDTQKRWSEEFCKATEEVFFEIFPELKESEDEKIRKAQLDYWRSVGGKEWHGVPVQEVIAWLEKQAPKPKWTEEDEIGSDETIELLEYFNNYAPEFRRPAIRRSINWLKSLKQRMEEQE